MRYARQYFLSILSSIPNENYGNFERNWFGFRDVSIGSDYLKIFKDAVLSDYEGELESWNDVGYIKFSNEMLSGYEKKCEYTTLIRDYDEKVYGIRSLFDKMSMEHYITFRYYSWRELPRAHNQHRTIIKQIFGL